MLDHMRMRKLEPRTQEGSIRAVRKLTAYLKRLSDPTTVEDLCNFQPYLVDAGTSATPLNQQSRRACVATPRSPPPPAVPCVWHHAPVKPLAGADSAPRPCHP